MLVAETLDLNPRIINYQFFYDQDCQTVYMTKPSHGIPLENTITLTSTIMDGASGTRLSSHIMSGVRHMHAGGVIHGNFSMKCILIQQETHGMLAQVSDFGAASVASGWKGQKPTPRDDIKGVRQREECSYAFAYAAPETLDKSRKRRGFPKDDWFGTQICFLTQPGAFRLTNL